MLCKPRVSVTLDMEHAVRIRLIKLSRDTFQFENVNLPQRKSMNEVPLCLTVRLSLHRISPNKTMRECLMGPTEFHHNGKHICKVQLKIKNIKCSAMMVFANPVASILTDM
jgi:hypothetical protein